jgi:Peptidase_C39 like family
LSVNQLNITPQYGFRNGGLVNTWLGADGDSLFKYLTNGYGINFQRVDSNYSIAVKDTNVTPGNTLNSYQSGFGRYQDWNLEKVGGQYGDTYLFHWRTDLDTNLCLDIRGFGQGQKLDNQIPVVWHCDRNNVNQRIRVIKQAQSPISNQSSSQFTTSIGQANQVFKTQYYSNYNTDGPNGSRNCGPTSVAMIMKWLGKEPANLSTQGSINLARRNMGMVGNEDANENQLVTGLRNAGLQVANHFRDGNWQQLDQDLAAGKPVVAWGFYGAAWRNQFPSYSLTGGVSNDGTDHLNAILGKTANGNYVVADPMYRGGAVEMTRSQLAVFFSYGKGHDGRPYFLTASR